LYVDIHSFWAYNIGKKTASIALFESDITIFTPARSPRVSHDEIIVSIAHSGNIVVQSPVMAVCGGHNTTFIIHDAVGINTD
jgi:hypothetical protein